MYPEAPTHHRSYSPTASVGESAVATLRRGHPHSSTIRFVEAVPELTHGGSLAISP
jgi:hypothetical protein